MLHFVGHVQKTPTHDRSFSPGFQGRASFKLATSLTCGRISDLARFRLQHSFNNSGPTFGPYKRSLRSFSSCKRRSCDGICSNVTLPRLGLRSMGVPPGRTGRLPETGTGPRETHSSALFDLAATKARNGYPPRMAVRASGRRLKTRLYHRAALGQAGDYNRIAVRHMTASPEKGPVVLIYGCSECNWIYRALTPEEASQ